MISRSVSISIAMSIASAGWLLAITGFAPQKKQPRNVSHQSSASPTVDNSFGKEILPLVGKYCGNCHSATSKAAGLALTTYRDIKSVLKGREVWERVASNVNSGVMPPKGSPEPSTAERLKITSWIESTLSKADCQLKDPGRVTMRRLNREEYNNTIRDLFGITLRPADEFPSDDVGYGFDNIGDVLSISPLLMEKYITAAERVSRAVILTDRWGKSLKHWDGAELNSDLKFATEGKTGRVLSTDGEVYSGYAFSTEGDYQIRVKAHGDQAGAEPVKMRLKIGSISTPVIEVPVEASSATVYRSILHVATGRQKISVAFLNDFYDPKIADAKHRDRNLIVESIEIFGPKIVNSANLPEAHRKIIPDDPPQIGTEDYARTILARLVSRAYRRPANRDDVDRLMKCYQAAKGAGDSFEKGIQLAIQAILISPKFLFRMELDDRPNDAGTKRTLNDFELASRMSYFLWASMPDEELTALAGKGKLKDKATVEAQCRRMLLDTKSRALVDNFAAQWLTLRTLNTVGPDTGRFPGFNENLRKDMRRETEMFAQAIFQDKGPILDFLDSKYTYLNERLAKHYGIDGVQGEDFKRVAVDGERRGGLITQASILTVTSNPTRTSPVKRGKWVLEQILGTPPPPPPPNVPELKDKKELTGTLRQRMEQHRKDPNCATCHARLDPMGFGLENYDAVGAWRDKEGDSQVDSSGVLPEGRTFNGPAQLKGILKGKKTLFVKALTEKLMTYALGRGLEYADRCNVQTIAANVGRSDYRFSSMVTGIVSSDSFRMRKGDGGAK